MTDEAGRRPRSSTVALLAPAAAAVLAGSLAWAAAHPPAPPLAKSAATVEPSPTSAPPAAERARQVRDLDRLRRQVTSLRAELKDLEGTRSDRRSDSDDAGAGKEATAKPRPKPKPRPARTAPPPVQATTGAS